MLRSVIVALLLAVSASPQGDQSVNALKTCLADNTTGKDRKDLAKWIFLAIAAHPEIKQHASADAPAAADQSSRTMAALVMRLLTDSCVTEMRTVVKSGDASQSMQLAFAGLGQLAMQELMADKSVKDSMELFVRYVDAPRLREVLGVK